MEYLVFQVYSPLVSWGTQAVGQERASDDHPGRSSLLGLLAAALGIDREDDEAQWKLSEACCFAVKQFSAGISLRDFHTTQVPPEDKKARHILTRKNELRQAKLGTILSYRSYQQESFQLIAVQSRDVSFPLSVIKQALEQPVFHLYFGRKSCPPALPLNPVIIEQPDLKQAFDSYECLTKLDIRNDQSRYFWEAAMEQTGMQTNYRVTRYDQPLSRHRWQFAPVEEHVFIGG